MVEKYGLVKGDLECFEVQAEEVLNVPFLTLRDVCEAMLCKALEECGMEDEAIREASDVLSEKFNEMGEEREEREEAIARLLEWRWTHGFEEEKER